MSPRAAVVAGRSEVVGREALLDYWNAALASIEHLEFVPDRYLSDGDELVILYTVVRDGRRWRAAEFFRFLPDGLVSRGEAMYGATY